MADVVFLFGSQIWVIDRTHGLNTESDEMRRQICEPDIHCERILLRNIKL
jgi:hypothetical protein